MNKRMRYLLTILVAGLALTLALVGFSQPVQADIPTEDLNNILTYGLTDSGLYPTPQWMAEGNQTSAVFGHSVATAGDVNDDGYEDVIVGSYGYDVGDTTVLTNAGRAYVYYGSPTGLSATPDWTIEGDQVGGSLGQSVGTAGDVNGDGYDDVIVGAYAYDVITGATVLTDAGRVYIYYGSAAGLSTTPAWTADGDQEGGLFGSSVATAGNVNGDTYDDIIIGAYKYDHGHTDEGRVYVYHGSSSGPGATADWTAESDQTNTYFGEKVGTAGDVNGDGYDEVIVGARWYAKPTSYEGAIFVWYGSNTGLGANGDPANADWLAESDHWGYHFGRGASTAGDVNGDGYDDVIAGSHLYNLGGTIGQGAAFGWYGSATGLGPNGNFTNADWMVIGDQTNGYFGYTVANAGDVNGDGYDDALVGAYGYDNGETDEGRAYLFLGSGSGLNTTAAWTVEGDQVSAVLGYSLATAGDVNGDGYDDAIIGAHGYDNGETDEGRAYVYRGWACRAQIDGGSTIYDTVQDGVDASTSATDVVKVSGYCPGVSARAGVTQSVYLSKTLTIQGGYLPDFSNVPDPAAYPTTLDALGEGRVLYITGDINPVIEGLRFTGGNAAGLGGIGQFGDRDGGGGVYVVTATATISNCYVFSNTAEGGAGIADVGNAHLLNNEITANTATDQGGGGVLAGGATTLEGNLIHGNVSTGGPGGGVAGFYSDLTLIGNDIISNTTGEDGGGVYLLGCNGATLTGNTVTSNTAPDGSAGGIKLDSSDGATLSENNILSNTAKWTGGGVFLDNSDATLTDNTITHNRGHEGSGIYLAASAAALNGNTIADNTATWRGGAVALYEAEATLSRNLIISNTATWHGAGIWAYSSTLTLENNIIGYHTLIENVAPGAGVELHASEAHLIHTTLAENGGSTHAGVALADGSTAWLTNTIMVAHGTGIEVQTGCTATLTATLWGTGAWSNDLDWDGAGAILTGTVNMWGDPDFVAPANQDYHIGQNSAAVDAGVDTGVTTDIDGDARPIGRPDLGADEWGTRIYLPLVLRNFP